MACNKFGWAMSVVSFARSNTPLSEEMLRRELALLLSRKGLSLQEAYKEIKTRRDDYGSVVLELGPCSCVIYKNDLFYSLDEVSRRFLNSFAIDCVLSRLMAGKD